MRSVQLVIYISCLVYFSSCQSSDINNYDFLTPLGHYIPRIRGFNYKYTDEIGDSMSNIRNGVHKFIKIMNPFSFLWIDRSPRPMRTSDENWNQNKYSTYTNTNLNKSTQKDEGSSQLENNNDIYKLKNNVKLEEMGKQWNTGLNGKTNSQEVISNISPNESVGKFEFTRHPNLVNDNSQTSNYITKLSNKNNFNDNYSPRGGPLKQSEFQPQHIESQSADLSQDQNPHNNYNTDIVHNYKSLAAFNLNVAPFLTRRTRSVRVGSRFPRTPFPLIVSPYLSTHKAQYDNTHLVATVGAKGPVIYYSSSNHPSRIIHLNTKPIYSLNSHTNFPTPGFIL